MAYLGTRLSRKFVLYVSGTQEQANRHVGSIAHHFEAQGINRAINRYGISRGWRMDLLRTEGGFNVLAFGLDTAGRGAKLDDDRPDLFIFDDVDDRHDSELVVEKKITTITDSILPMGSPDAAVLVVQNKVHANSVVTRLTDGRADFLHGRHVHVDRAVDLTEEDLDALGLEEASRVEARRQGLVLEGSIDPDGIRTYRIAAGRPTWPGQDLATCEYQINTWGRSAFLREAQHDLTEAEGGLWNRARDIDPFRFPTPARGERGRFPTDLRRICVAIDPNATGTADAAGIMVGGILRHPPRPGDRNAKGTDHGYLLEDVTVGGGPRAWAKAACEAFWRWQADSMVAEQNNGGEMVAITIETEARAGIETQGAGREPPRVILVNATRGKVTRATPVQKLCEDGRIHHCGVFVELERELCSWREGEPSPNRLDAYVWLWSYLMLQPKKRMDVVGLSPWAGQD